MTETTREEEIRDQFISAIGTWGEPWETLLKIDPQFVSSYARLYSVPSAKGRLSPKFQQLCYLAVSASAMHLYAPGIRAHVRAALDVGATPEEIVEVLELISTVGIHAMNIGVPLLVEVLEERGRTEPVELDETQERLKAEFIRTRGYWHEFWNDILELDPEIFEAYTEFSSVPWRTGPLTPAEKELIYIAYDISATHLYVPGTKLHIRNALNHGATVEEVLEVMEISTSVGLHAVATAMPLLAEELARRESPN